MRLKSTLAVIPLLCSGCSLAPSVAVFGAFFPGWMVCALLGIVLALLACLLAGGAGLIAPPVPPLLYPLLALFFAALAWIILFAGVFA